MAERGIHVSRESSKSWTDGTVQAADVAITMACGDACLIFPGKRYLDGVPTSSPARASKTSTRSATRSNAAATGGLSATHQMPVRSVRVTMHGVLRREPPQSRPDGVTSRNEEKLG
jgi:hypothetical protein